MFKSVLAAVALTLSFTASAQDFTLNITGQFTGGGASSGQSFSALLTFNDVAPTSLDTTGDYRVGQWLTVAPTATALTAVVTLADGSMHELGTQGTVANYSTIGVGRWAASGSNSYGIGTGNNYLNGSQDWFSLSVSDNYGDDSAIFEAPGLSFSQQVNWRAPGSGFTGMLTFGLGTEDDFGGAFRLTSVSYAEVPPPIPAVPEPSTYALMLAGLGAVAFMARRRPAAAA